YAPAARAVASARPRPAYTTGCGVCDWAVRGIIPEARGKGLAKSKDGRPGRGSTLPIVSERAARRRPLATRRSPLSPGNRPMSRPAYLLATRFLLCGHAAASPPDVAPASRARLPDGVYAVRRDGPREKDVLPLREGEVLAVDRHRYLNRGEREPPRFLVVRSA